MNPAIPKNAKLFTVGYFTCIVLTWWGLWSHIQGYDGQSLYQALWIAGGGLVTGLTARNVIDLFIYRIDPFEAGRRKLAKFFPSRDDKTWNEMLYLELMVHHRFDIGYLLRKCLLHRFDLTVKRDDWPAAHMALTLFTLLEDLRTQVGSDAPPEKRKEGALVCQREIQYFLSTLWEHYMCTGIVFDVHLTAIEPLAMGHYHPNVSTRLTRELGAA